MLARALIATIHLYRGAARRIPRSRSCLFAISCSQHVERTAAEQGFRSALHAMRARFAACRPGYSFVYDGTRWHAICVDGSIIAGDDASNAVRYEATLCRRILPQGKELCSDNAAECLQPARTRSGLRPKDRSGAIVSSARVPAVAASRRAVR